MLVLKLYFFSSILRDFFDACDGIFLNYVWTPENLINSITTAEDRVLDVYVGVDVFGRNCFGGGGFNTAAALSEIRQKGLSAAIFAPGWVYECHPIELFSDLSLTLVSLITVLESSRAYLITYPN